MAKRIIAGIGTSWLFSVTLGAVYVFSGFGLNAFSLPAIFITSLGISTLISLLFAPLAIWAVKTGKRNLVLFGPILWLMLAAHIVVGVRHFLPLTQTSLFALAILGLIALGLIPRQISRAGGPDTDQTKT